MADRLLKLSRLYSRERIIVSLLRGDVTRKINVRYREPLASLRAAARDEGLTLQEANAQYLSADEVHLLGLLTSLQRRQPEYAYDASDALRGVLEKCSQKLCDLGILLDRRNMTRMPRLTTADGLLNVRPRYVLPDTPVTDRRFVAPTPSSLQARALRFGADRGSTSARALQAFGASRAVTHLMFKRGLLVRTGLGVYEASCDAILWLEQSKGSLQCSSVHSLPLSLQSRA